METVDSENILLFLLRWAWVSFFAFLIHMYRKITGVETQYLLLEQQSDNFKEQQAKDEERFEQYRKDQRESMKGIYDRLDELTKILLKQRAPNDNEGR